MDVKKAVILAGGGYSNIYAVLVYRNSQALKIEYNS